MPETLRIPLRIVFYKEDGDWIAHCLEFDLIGTGETQEEALSVLSEAIALQIKASLKYQNPANLFSPADGKILHMFAAGRHVAIGAVELTAIHADNVAIDAAEYREYVSADTVCA